MICTLYKLYFFSSDEDRIINDHFIGNRAKSKNTKATSKKNVKFGEVGNKESLEEREVQV